MIITGNELAKMSLEDIEKLYQKMKTPTQEQKECAWKKWIQDFMMSMETE